MQKIELIDTGVRQLSKSQPLGCDFEGIGTDAESALDDLLHNLQVAGYDVTGLEARIRSEWNPTMAEGDGMNTYYQLQLRLT